MTDPYAHRRFRRIETKAVLPSGRLITSWRSYPLGVGKDVYDRIDADLVRAFGNDASRTVGTFADDPTACVKSDRTRRTDAAQPLPCIVCGKQLDSAANDPAFDRVPYAGTMFHTSGHYGSTVFDSFDGHRLQIVVCDDCLTAHHAERVLLVRPAEPGKDHEVLPWDGVTTEGERDTALTDDEIALLDRTAALFPAPDGIADEYLPPR